MKRSIFCFIILLCSATAALAEVTTIKMSVPLTDDQKKELENYTPPKWPGGGEFPAPGENCLYCHKGIAPIRAHDSKMMEKIYEAGRKVGDPNGCVVCHAGTPTELYNKDIAHSGAPKGNMLQDYSPVPAALQVNAKTCGQCHEYQTYSTHRSIMNSDSGKIKAITWSWGLSLENKDHKYANHAIQDPDGTIPVYGSAQYKDYMATMIDQFPGQFPTKLEKLPAVSMENLKEFPQQAAYSQLRGCNKCHLTSKGPSERGRYRGMGCAACHMMYSNGAYYEGNDRSIDRTKQGMPMVHAIQATRKSKIYINGTELSGIQVSTCGACHTGGRRIAATYQGLMPLGSSYNRGPFDRFGRPQQKTSGATYKYLRDDVHHRITEDGTVKGGMLCQDCHTTGGIHGDGNIRATTLAAVEIECSDCHGTPTAYPWELPLGFGDEYQKDLSQAAPRGISKDLDKEMASFATVYPPQDGYLLTARGNTFGNVVKDGDKVILFSANGTQYDVPILKELRKTDKWNSPEKAKTAMIGVSRHMQSLECYSCHSTWVAQYYGYKQVYDFSKQSIDWLESSEVVYKDGTTAGYRGNVLYTPGAGVRSDYSHIGWITPVLGINGEGRVTPLTGVIQTVGTVFGADGNTLMFNEVAQRSNGVDAITMAPIAPHTTSLAARECFDCHGNSQTAGYGQDNGAYDAMPWIPRILDVVTAKGAIVSKHSIEQIPAIKKLHGDFMQILDKDGNQLMTVDSHWPTSSPLTSEQREKMDRLRTCQACHSQMPDMDNASVSMVFLANMADVLNITYTSGVDHANLVAENNLLIAWIKTIAIFGALILIPCVILYILWRWRKKSHAQ